MRNVNMLELSVGMRKLLVALCLFVTCDSYLQLVPCYMSRLSPCKTDWRSLSRPAQKCTVQLQCSMNNLEGSVLKSIPPRMSVPNLKRKKLDQDLGEELFEAVKAGDVEKIRNLCEIGLDGAKADPEYSDEFGFTCLHLAAKRGNLAVVEALISLGADVNVCGEDRAFPLHTAARYGKLQVVKRLVELGADVDLQDGSGSTPLRVATSFGHKDVVEFLRPLRNSGSGQWSSFEAERAAETLGDMERWAGVDPGWESELDDPEYDDVDPADVFGVSGPSDPLDPLDGVPGPFDAIDVVPGPSDAIDAGPAPEPPSPPQARKTRRMTPPPPPPRAEKPARADPELEGQLDDALRPK